MRTYRYYKLHDGEVVGVRQPEQRYTHVGDLLTTRTFVRVVGRQYDGTFGEFGISADTLAEAAEISPTTVRLYEPELVVYIETHRRSQVQVSHCEPKVGQRSTAVGTRVPA